MLWYEWTFILSKILTSSVSFIALLWCLYVLFHYSFSSLGSAIKNNRITASLTGLAFLDFASTTFALVFSVEVTPEILMWSLLIRMIPSTLVSLILMYAVTKIKFIEDDAKIRERNEEIRKGVLRKGMVD